MKAAGADGCPTNTGPNGGVIRLLEVHLGRALQWLICLLHLNELPFKYYFAFIDGETAGPGTYSGPIGKTLKDAETLPVVKFRRMNFTKPPVDIELMSSDQRYLLDLCIAISEGKCSPGLARTKGGPVNGSRWTTTAARALRTYIGTQSPSTQLRKIVKYILEVYAPVWVAIKTRPKCIDGSKHLHYLIKRSRYLPKAERAVVDRAIQTSGFYGHPENVLLAMLFDER